MSHLNEHLAERGYHAFFVPEAATDLISGHQIHPSMFKGKNAMLDFQRLVIEKQIQNEELVLRAIKRANSLTAKPVIIADRGIMDSLAYFRRSGLEDIKFKQLLEKLGAGDLMYNLKARYGLVVFLEIPPREIYNRIKANNPARQEDFDSAWRTNELLKGAWTGSNLKIVDNPEGTFEEKIRRALSLIDNELGDPPVEHERKFLVSEDISFPTGLESRLFRIEQIYLQNNSAEVSSERVRAMTLLSEGVTYYYHTVKYKKAKFGLGEKERRISKEEFIEILSSRETIGRVIKDRYCFAKGSSHFELDLFREPNIVKGRAIVEIEGGEDIKDKKITFPEFLKIGEEVTSAISNKAIAQGKASILAESPRIKVIS